MYCEYSHPKSRVMYLTDVDIHHSLRECYLESEVEPIAGLTYNEITH